MTCITCGNTPSTPCGGCGGVQYCGKECQRKDWKQHKPKCKCYKAAESSEEHGRHMIASRDIRAGEKILCTGPDILGPRTFQPTPCCLGCHSGTKKLIACDKCGLPVCSTKCTASNFHQLECALISKYGGNLSGDEKINLSMVLPLRIVALQFTKPELYRQILKMESNHQEIKKGQKWSTYEKNVMGPILGLKVPEMTRELVEQVVGIILTNTFEVVTQQAVLVGIFMDPSLMNHHCVGNVRVSMDGGGKMTVLASVPIKKNAPIKFNYVKALDTTSVRQVQLRENKFFDCLCNRCTDPAEIGSYVSAHRCKNDSCSGDVLPVDPVNLKEEWECRACKERTPVSQIRKTTKSLDKEMQQIDRNDMKSLKKILNKYKQKLNKNHGTLTEVKQMIVSGYGRLPEFQVEDMTEADHKLKIELCQEILQVLDIVEPGLNLGRGLILFELHTSLVMLANLEFEKRQNPNQLLIRLQEADRILGEADNILKLEPVSSPYGHLAATIQRNRKELGGYIENVKMM